MPEVTELTLSEVGRHDQGGDLWVCIRGHVYDVSIFIDEHPGGEEVLRAFAGKDATEAFEDASHSEEAKTIMEGLFVGRISSLHQSIVTTNTQQPAAVVSSRKSTVETSQALVVPKDTRHQVKKFIGLWFAVVAALVFTVAASGFAVFVILGTTATLASLGCGFAAVTARHRGAEDYADYIGSKLTG